jgi:hypothetical protein
MIFENGDLMGFVKDCIERLAKEKWIVYLLLLWAGGRFFWGLNGILNYGFDVSWIIGAVANLLYLLTGVFLALFAVKLLERDIFAALSNERMFALFLLFWGGSSFLFAVQDIIYYGGAGMAVPLIATLFGLLAGVVLLMLGFKLFQNKETSSADN